MCSHDSRNYNTVINKDHREKYHKKDDEHIEDKFYIIEKMINLKYNVLHDLTAIEYIKNLDIVTNIENSISELYKEYWELKKL